uniref:Carboxymuconolactone decarboxylase family protein n=1 Tax=Desulfobacca acetoxidans TaxID=60893 RepID=A0A7V4G8Q5_9BACT
MAPETYPPWYRFIKEHHPKFMAALEQLGEAVRAEGPVSGPTAHLIQLAAAAAIRSEGAVHSHTRRALEAGAQPGEIYHALILLTSTIGFPTVSAALSWAHDAVRKATGG